MKDKRIGFVGLGNVGSKIAYNILKNKNYSLYVFDLNKITTKKLVSEGAILCNSIEELINSVTVFITCLPSPNSVKKFLVSVLGGGDTVSAINRSGLKLSFTHLSTAGGAFLEYLEGKDLPGLSVLK